MKKTLLILLCLLLASFSFSQTYQFIDVETEEPVANVAVFNQNKTKSALSDKNGKVHLELFETNETLTTQHPSYKSIIFKTSELNTQKIYLEKEVFQIEEYVISAYRWEQNKNEIPNKITRISQQEIKFNNPQTAADLLAKSNEVFVQKSQLGGGSPMIRGFATNTVLLVVDGVRLNNAIFREGNVQNVISLDPNAIESSEIIFGPGSVTYGSDALGGVMDFHTLRPKLSTSEKVYFSGNALTRYSSANFEKTGHIDLNLGFEKWAFLTSFSYSDFDDLRMGSQNNAEYRRFEYVERINGIDSIVTNDNENVQVQSAYSQINFMQKLRYRPNNDLDMIYAFHYSKLSDVPRYDRLIRYRNGILEFGDWYYGPQEWMMHNLNLDYSKSNKIFDDLKLTLAYQEYKESRHDRKYKSNELTEAFEKVKAYSFNLDFDKDLKRDNQLFYGVEVVYNSVKSKAHIKNIQTGDIVKTQSRYPDGKNDYTTLAAYISYKENFTDKFTTIAGVRANYVSIYSTLKDTSFFNFPFDEISVNNSSVNGSIGLVYKPGKQWQLNMNLSSGFHAPNIDDMAKIFDPEPGTIIVPNQNLKPEYAYNIDFGIQKEFWDKLSFNITAYYTYLTNAFVRREYSFNGQDSIYYKGELSQVLAIVNADKAYIYGFSSTLNFDFTENFNLESTINYTHGEDQDGETLRHAAPLFGSTSLKYNKDKTTISVIANYNGEIKYEDLAPSEKGKPYLYATDKNGNPYSPAWCTLNIMGSYKIKNWLSVNAGLENILDNRYRPYSSGISAPGRNFILSLNLKF